MFEQLTVCGTEKTVHNIESSSWKAKDYPSDSCKLFGRVCLLL